MSLTEVMENRPIRPPYSLGFIGGGLNSAVGYAHSVAARMDHIWSLDSGVFSRSFKENLQAAHVYGVETSRAYPSIGELLKSESERLDAVVILTPTDSHFEMVMKCLDAGIAVICEKALAETSEKVRAIEVACRAKSGFLAVIYNYSGYPMVRELRDLVRRGELGEILHFQIEMPQEGFIRTDPHGRKLVPQEWRLNDGPIPTLYLDLAVHLHQLVNYLTGQQPVETIAEQSSRGAFGIIDNVSALCNYTGQLSGQVWFSKCAMGQRNGLRVRLYGSKASAEWYQLNPEELQISFMNGRREIMDRASYAPVASMKRYQRFKAGHPAGFVEALANLYSDISDSLQGFRSSGQLQSDEVFGVSLAAEGLRLFEAMVRSAASRRWEQIGH